MPFNPDEYLEAKKADFNPDAYLQAKNTPEVPQWESAVRGLNQGLTFGLADEAVGGVSALGQAAQKGSLSDIVKDYIASRDQYRSRDKIAEAANPKTFMAGDLPGSIGTMFVPGLNAAKGAGILTRLGYGGVQGGLNALGRSEADNAEDLTKDVGLGGLVGVAGAGAGELASHAIPTAMGSKALAESKAVEHLRPTPKVARILGPQKLNAIGREALDSGAIGFGSKSGTTAGNLDSLRSKAGEEMSEFIKNSKAQIDPQEIATNFQRDVIDPLKTTAANKNIVSRLENQKAEFLAHYGGGALSPTQVEAEKVAVNKGINYLTDPKPAQEAQMGWANTLKEASEHGIDDPNFISAKQKYGKLAQGQTMAERTAGLTDHGKGLIGHMYDATAGVIGGNALMHGNPAGLAVIGGRALLGGRTASGLAVGADKASKFLQRNPVADAVMRSLETGVDKGAQALSRSADMYTRKDPMSPESISEQLSKSPEARKFDSAIQKAAAEGQEALVATHFILSQTEPDYQKAFLGE